MKKRLLTAALCLITLLASSSCSPKNEAAPIDTPIPEKAPGTLIPDDLPPGSTIEVMEDGSLKVETPASSEEEAFTKEDFLEIFNGSVNENKEIDRIASNFMQSLTANDKDSISSFLGGKSVYYGFLNDNTVESYELLPLDMEIDGYEYTNDYRRSYICEITVSDESEYFSATNCLYYLETTDYPELGNSVYYFLPLEDAASILIPDTIIPESRSRYSYFVKTLTDAYGSTFVLGENPASSIDFNNVTGFHFIPHSMFYFQNNNLYDRPHSMTEINEFISLTFFENKGVELKGYSDYDLWVSDGDGYTEYSQFSYDDKIYGCFYGHGTTWAIMRICDYEETKGGINITVQTYADYASFAKSKKLVYKFAPDVDNTLPLLYSVEVVEDTSYPTAYGSL